MHIIAHNNKRRFSYIGTRVITNAPDPRVCRSTERFGCEFLEKSLHLVYHKVQSCCQPGVPIQLDIDQFSIDRYLQQRQRILQSFATNEFLSCKGCAYIRRFRNPVQNDHFNRVTIAHFTTCNLRCAYCTLNKGSQIIPHRQYSEQVFKIVAQLCALNKISPTAEVGVGGGEPSLWPDLDRYCSMLIDYSERLFFYFLTNALVPSKTLIKLLRSDYRTHINISIDSGTPKGYLRIKGRDCYDIVCNNIEHYQRAASRLTHA